MTAVTEAISVIQGFHPFEKPVASAVVASARPADPRILRTFASSVAEALHRREHLPPSASDLVFGARVLLPEGQ